MDMLKIARFIELTNEKATNKSRLDEINAEMKALEAELLPQYAEDGVQSVNKDGRTVYLAQLITARPNEGLDKTAICAALKRSSLAQYVAPAYNTNSLDAFVRERAAEVRDLCTQEKRVFTPEEVVKALPKPLQKVLKVSFIPQLKSTSSRK